MVKAFQKVAPSLLFMLPPFPWPNIYAHKYTLLMTLWEACGGEHIQNVRACRETKGCCIFRSLCGIGRGMQFCPGSQRGECQSCNVVQMRGTQCPVLKLQGSRVDKERDEFVCYASMHAAQTVCSLQNYKFSEFGPQKHVIKLQQHSQGKPCSVQNGNNPNSQFSHTFISMLSSNLYFSLCDKQHSFLQCVFFNVGYCKLLNGYRQ